MTRALVSLLLAAGMVTGCGPATADTEPAAAAPVVAAAEAPAANAAAEPTTATGAADPAAGGSCDGGPGGSCCGGGDGACSQMAEADDMDGGCPCQRRQRLIEKGRTLSGDE